MGQDANELEAFGETARIAKHSRIAVITIIAEVAVIDRTGRKRGMAFGMPKMADQSLLVIRMGYHAMEAMMMFGHLHAICWMRKGKPHLRKADGE
jgi:hypothetical protein